MVWIDGISRYAIKLVHSKVENAENCKIVDKYLMYFKQPTAKKLQ